jgi:hypothetical protein
MTTATAQLKRRMKFAPKMGRELSAEYLLAQVNAAPRRLSPCTIEKLRLELERLATSTDPKVRRFIEAMAERYSGVCD